EKMTDVIDSGSDTEENGLLSAELTASHFGGGGGGGLLRKKNTGDEDEEHKPKSRQELIEELILKSKQEKRERQIQKEEAHVLTEKLDQEWRSIQNLLSRKTTKPEQKDLPEKTKIHSLCQMFPDAACKVMQTLLSDSAHSMEETLEVRGRAAMPDLDMLVYLKITALLFPTSDFRHPVSTPAFLYISQTLTKCSVVSLEDVCRGLVLCCLAVEFVSLSQRFFPEMLNFLLGLLHLAVPEKTNTGYVLVSPFRQQGRNCDLLVVKDSSASLSWSRKPVSLCTAHRNTLDTPLERDHYRLSIIDACLDLVKRCTTLYTDLTSYSLIFQPIRTLLLEHLPAKSYPAEIQDVQKEIVEAISANPSQHAPLVFKKKKPIPLKLFTPKIVQILDYGKKRGDTKEEKERERLKHKYKREFKGALREIRKDSRFLAHEKLSDIISRDTERKRKVKELYGSLSTQEGEWKALKRKKGK
ncbi:hypothetical protein IRJ41_020469, partial [Triplophysa rosa]